MFVIKREIEYRDHKIFLWVKEAASYKNMPERGLYFDIGWSSSACGGFYNSGVEASRAEERLIDFLIEAKYAIDKILAAPQQLEAAKKRIENLILT